MSQRHVELLSSEYYAVRSNRMAFGGGSPNGVPKNFSPVIEGSLYGMALPVDRGQMEHIEKEHNVRLVVSAIETKNCPPVDMFLSQVKQYHINWRDHAVPTEAQVNEVLDVMNIVITNDKKAVAVHCFAGKGRTGTLLACYLVRYCGHGAAQSIGKVRTCRPGSIETIDQERFIFDFHARECAKRRRRRRAAHSTSTSAPAAAAPASDREDHSMGAHDDDDEVCDHENEEQEQEEEDFEFFKETDASIAFKPTGRGGFKFGRGLKPVSRP
eukprot:TRINITY_DN4203_c2_g1_i1.p1 TRINITY_DN4203_c2_g1~~TRINITY_DN4203_c2_g1_i1.p1  ORF type:complete len:270 (+),score=43.44 TRINITY_DN4203_c2_g1_i1:155-964(+)